MIVLPLQPSVSYHWSSVSRKTMFGRVSFAFCVAKAGGDADMRDDPSSRPHDSNGSWGSLVVRKLRQDDERPQMLVSDFRQTSIVLRFRNSQSSRNSNSRTTPRACRTPGMKSKQHSSTFTTACEKLPHRNAASGGQMKQSNRRILTTCVSANGGGQLIQLLPRELDSQQSHAASPNWTSKHGTKGQSRPGSAGRRSVRWIRRAL